MNICYSGGAKGADQLFGELATSAGHKVYHWSFLDHHSPCPKEQIHKLVYKDLMVAEPYLIKANEYLERTYPTKSEYVNNLLRRNYYQVQSADRIYSSTAFDADMKPLGGTAWAIVMGIDLNVPEVYNYDWSRSKWFEFNYFNRTWEPRASVRSPIDGLCRYAGIGSSELPYNGEQAIRKLYEFD